MLSSIIQLTNVVSSDKIQQTHFYTKSEHIVTIMQCSVKTTSESIPSRALFRNRTEMEKIKVIKELPTIITYSPSLVDASFSNCMHYISASAGHAFLALPPLSLFL